MTHHSHFALRPMGTRKRVLLVGATTGNCDERSECLRDRGYDVDSASCTEAAIHLTRTRSYDLIVLPADMDGPVELLCRKLQRMSPNSMIACMVDCKKPIPAVRPDRMLWKGEPLEYFVARLEALSATA